MANIFISIYRYFAGHKLIMYLSMCLLFITMSYFALKVTYVEDITSFFPKNGQEQNLSLIFNNIKSKDRLVVMFTANKEENSSHSIELAQKFRESLESNENFTSHAKITTGTQDFSVEEMTNFVYDNLPVLLTDEDYIHLDSITQEKNVREKLHHCYDNLMSIYGSYISDFIYTDPLSLSGDAMQQFQRLGGHYDYSIQDDYIFLSNNRTLICNIDIVNKDASISKLIDLIEDELEQINDSQDIVLADYFGAPAVAEYNARVIKRDSIIAVNIAVLIVIILITLAFRSKRNVLLLILPIIFGAIFALALVYFIQGEMSIIAVGSGSIIFAIALSYAIHMMVHTSHCKDVEELLNELTLPLTIGSFTTVGAFVGLTFTSSTLLQDFGLFASLMLLGTTLFSLIYLPHFLKFKKVGSDKSFVIRTLNKVAGLNVDKNKPIVYFVLLATLIFSIWFSDVRFDSDMMNLNYNPPHLAQAEKRLNELANLNANIVFVSASTDKNDAAQSYGKLCDELEELMADSVIESYSDIDFFIVEDSIQEHRIERWNKFWTEKRRQNVTNWVNDEAAKLGFEDGAFDGFKQLITKHYGKLSIETDYPKVLEEWVSSTDSLTTIMVHVKMDAENKEFVYSNLAEETNAIALDRSFFAGKMAQDVKDNFSLILYISSLLIFIALFFSYGRLELAILAFLPMFISWVVILGIMSLLGIEFNIVTIILSTFIFGIGDDFSIFVMDGLIAENKQRSSTLQHHRTAIVLSGISLIVGMGVLVFTKHPAMNSLGTLSFIGMLIVLLVSFTVQPFLFRLLITNYSQKGSFPFTFLLLINTIYSFVFFVLACFIVRIYMLLFYLVPIGAEKRKLSVHKVVCFFLKMFMKLQPTVKSKFINEHNESFKKPAVIIANHQSFIDILVLLAITPKLLMMTKSWVWNSPIFGSIVRYLDFFCIDEGYDTSLQMLKEKVAQGYSIVIFPEGTRSEDHNIKRFHKGAFYLAEHLNIDILPILLYGNGLISSKRQPLYIKKGTIVMKVLERITNNDKRFGTNYVERTKSTTKHFRTEYDKLYEQENRCSNSYFRDALLKNYIYKGPVLEWYMRVKLSIEKYYDEYDRLLPRTGKIVNLGCGYGAMSYMLMLLSKNRTLVGMDYDAEKIELATNCFSKNERISFETADIRTYDVPQADAFVISDVLHYVDEESQRQIINRCISKLNDGGLIVIRDGDKDLKERHKNTEKTELWSTQIIKFNKTAGELHFLSRTQIEEIASKHNMTVEVRECDSKTSNSLFIMRKLCVNKKQCAAPIAKS